MILGHVLALSANGAAGLVSYWFLLFPFLLHKVDLYHRRCVRLLLLIGWIIDLKAWPEHDFVCWSIMSAERFFAKQASFQYAFGVRAYHRGGS